MVRMMRLSSMWLIAGMVFGSRLASAGLTADYDRTPVLMVHGWFASDLAGVATWAALKAALIEDGWPEEYLDTPSFDDVRGCDPEHAEQIAGWVESLLARTGAERVDIVAHSEGALNTLYYLKKLCGVSRVRNLVSLDGAFHGTVVACLDPFSCGAREMCIGSKPDAWKENPVLADLLDCDETPGDVLYTTIWSPWDEIIVPPEGSILAGAKVIEVQTPFTEHAGVLWSDEVHGYVRDALLSGGANEDGPGWGCLPACAPGGPDPGGAFAEEVVPEPDAGLDRPRESVPEDRPQVGERDVPACEEAATAEDRLAEQDRGTADPGSIETDRSGRRPPQIGGGCVTSGRPSFRGIVWLLAGVAIGFLTARRGAGRA